MTHSVSIVYENAEVFVKILKDCGLPQVANWKPEDVKRALDWVQYFRKVNKHVTKSSIVAKLEDRVKEIGRSLAVRFGQEEASFHFLVHKSLHYCLQTLLANPVLPDQLRQYILSHHSDKLKLHEVETTCDHTVLATLSRIHRVLNDSVPENSLTHTLHSLDASYLTEDIFWLLQDNNDMKSKIVAERAKSAAAKRLSNLAEIDGGMNVILLALLLHPTGSGLVSGPVQYDSMDPPRKFILEWLVEVAQGWNKDTSSTKRLFGSNDGKLRVSWSQSKLLVRVSSTYFKFFKEHVKYLIVNTNKLNPTCLKKDEDSQESWEWILSQWVELVSQGQHLRDVLLHVIKSRAFPRMKSEEQAELYHELGEVGCTPDYWSPVPPSENLWIEVLKNVNIVLKEQ